MTIPCRLTSIPLGFTKMPPAERLLEDLQQMTPTKVKYISTHCWTVTVTMTFCLWCNKT